MESVFRIMVFKIGTESFGLEAAKLIRIVKKAETAGMSNVATADTVGVLNWQENVIPVLNLYERFQISPQAKQSGTYFIIVGQNGKQMAFPVDKVEQYYDVPVQCLRPIPSLVVSPGASYFQQIVDLGGRLVLVLEPESLFRCKY